MEVGGGELVGKEESVGAGKEKENGRIWSKYLRDARDYERMNTFKNLTFQGS